MPSSGSLKDKCILASSNSLAIANGQNCEPTSRILFISDGKLQEGALIVMFTILFFLSNSTTIFSYKILSLLIFLFSGVSLMPISSLGRLDFFAYSKARFCTVSSNFERLTNSSTKFHSTALCPRIPSVSVQK